jgi:hypothetical protein
MDRHGNTIRPRIPPRYAPELRKVPTASVRYGPDVSRNGRTVWAAFYGGELISIGASAGEARRNFQKEMRRREGKKD